MTQKTEGASAKSSTSDAQYSSQKQSTAQNHNNSAKCLIPDVRPSSEHTTEYNLNLDKILKVGQNIKFQVEAKSYIQKIITEVIIL